MSRPWSLLCLAMLPWQNLAFVTTTTTTSSSPPQPRAIPPLSTTSLKLAAVDLADGYNELLANYPLVTSSFTSGCLAGVGDAIAQHKEGQEEAEETTEPKKKQWTLPKPNLASFDTKRNRRFIIKGLGGGLIWLFWFRLADEITQSLMPLMNLGGEHDMGILPEATTILIGTTVLSILLDQFLASPVVFALWDIPLPIILSKNMEDDNKQKGDNTPRPPQAEVDIPQQIQDKLGGLLVANAKVWTFANAIIYNLPLEYRVVASSLTDLVWQSIVSSHVNDQPAATVPVPVATNEGNGQQQTDQRRLGY